MSDHRGFRRAVAALVTFGLLGISAELLLIDHFESLGQQLPLVVLPLAAVLLTPIARGFEPRSAATLRTVLAMVVVAGLVGVALHLYESWAFQAELDPSLGGAQRAWAALRAQSPPSLAPGQIALLGLLGLCCVRPSREADRVQQGATT